MLMADNEIVNVIFVFIRTQFSVINAFDLGILSFAAAAQAFSQSAVFSVNEQKNSIFAAHPSRQHS